VQPLLRRQPVEPLQQHIAGPVGEQYTQNHGDSNATRDTQPQSFPFFFFFTKREKRSSQHTPYARSCFPESKKTSLKD
jgi:hypothetical protein